MYYLPRKPIIALFLAAFFLQPLSAQHSIVHEWNQALLKTIEEDLALPHIQARNIFHYSIALYDAWAAYDSEASPYLLGKSPTCPFNGVSKPADIEAARMEAMSFAAYRFLSARFTHSPQATIIAPRFREIMQAHGYDFRNFSVDYSSGSPAALGNYVAQCVLQMSKADGSYEEKNYLGPKYPRLNPVLDVALPGTSNVIDPNRWQALKLKNAIDIDAYAVLECNCLGRTATSLIDSLDKDGRVQFTGTQSFQGFDWGRVKPFALKKQDRKIYQRDRHDFQLYQDPGADFLPKLDTLKGAGSSKAYQWNYSLVAAWSALVDPKDTTQWDVSPRSMGNVQTYPKNLAALPEFYDFESGRDHGTGYSINPLTKQPYTSRPVLRSDFVRAAVQYWAEGPNNETPPGHWISMLGYLSEQPGLIKKFNGKGRVMNQLEWDVKACFVLGGALHDAAISAWALKGRYDSARPITALRYMASRGQSSDPTLPSYHPAGIPLLPGKIELIKMGDTLAGLNNVHVGKIKIFAWNGPFAINDAKTQTAGVGWILAENWFPYQPKMPVTPPYAGFVSGHAAFAHAAAEAITLLTGDAFFPGGLGEFTVSANSPLISQEKGPSSDVPLQWATYRDAANQASLSRLWAGANAPFDDIPGRLLGAEVGTAAFQLAKSLFYKDTDQDGYFSYEDCDDNNPAVHPGAVELRDKLDNDCNGTIDKF